MGVGISLSSLELLVGEVIDNKDPNNLQRLKVKIPGVFDSEKMETDAIPWIYPFSSGSYQSYHSQPVGSRVWVIVFNDSHNGYMYMPYYESNAHTIDDVDKDNDCDVVVSRRTKGGKVSSISSTKSEMNLKGGSAQVKLSNNGNVDITNKESGAGVSVSGNNVIVGKSDGSEPAILGNKLYDKLSKFCDDLDELVQSASLSWTTQNLVLPLTTLSKNFRDSLEDIKSSSVKIS